MTCHKPNKGAENTGTNKGAVSTYNSTQCGSFASRTADGPGGCCASWAKVQMVAKNGGNLNNCYQSGVNACTISEWLTYWGFKMVCSGNTRGLPSGFQAMNGDVLINAGFNGHVYGHVQIYNNGNWYCDKNYKTSAGVYTSSNGNFWVIFRK